ncbi:VOC family protein [Rhodopirellula sp. MGV]|uniref:VOC family protein n=1 Tax=Rhodopirellula sp. MGV TaxID=2023130 RepID=UPI000B96FD7E|nr:VOC family protein [Rhodopirellula sp. MGV]OYP34168.1 lactoylglutathione lyase [Rhodopirellula sp. MGV]PNY33603.1 lactoylglutathione lyase [Rhodopirellula baltica]
MSKSIFVNLPVLDLPVSMQFYEAIGFKNNPTFTDETAACMVWSETFSLMLLTHAKWKTFTDRPIPPPNHSEVMVAMSLNSREAVDEVAKLAGENGGTPDVTPAQDYGFMYTRSFADPSGHVFEPMWMDLSAMPTSE